MLTQKIPINNYEHTQPTIALLSMISATFHD